MAPHSWFIGFAPYENPQIAIAVIVEEGGVGGGIAAQITRELIKTYLTIKVETCKICANTNIIKSDMK